MSFPSPSSPLDFPTKEWIYLAGILLLATAVRAALLGESAYYDEVWTMAEIDAPSFAEFWTAQRKSDPPSAVIAFYFSLLYFVCAAFGPGLLTGRIFSLVFGIATIALVYALGKRLDNARTGLLAALFLSLSLVHVYYSVEVRMYSLMLFLATLSVYTFVRLLQKPSKGLWAIHVMTNGFLVWTHLFAALIPVVECGFLLYMGLARTRAMGMWLCAHIVLASFASTWLAFMWTDAAAEVALWMPRPPLDQLANAFVIFAGGRYTNWNPAPLLPGGISLDLALAVCLYAMAAWLLARSVRRPAKEDKQFKAIILLWVWLAAPPLAIFAISWVGQPLFVYRYALFSAIPLFLMAAWVVAAVPHSRVRIGMTALVVLLFTYQLLAIRQPLRPDYAGAGERIESAGAAEAPILAFKEYNAGSIAYNTNLADGRIKTVLDIDDLLARSVQITDEGVPIWIIMWRWEQMEDFEAGLLSEGLSFRVTTHGGLPRLYLYRVERENAG